MNTIQHPMNAFQANRQVNNTQGNLQKSMEKLSSGYRINRASDDACALSISEKLRWQIRGLDQGSTNTEDGISLLQVADGALAEIHQILNRIEELLVQGANDTNTLSDRQDIHKEITSLLAEIDRIGNDTEFNTQKIFRGGEIPILDANGNPTPPIGSLPFSEFSLSDLSLDETNAPFNENSAANYLHLAACLNTENYNPHVWSLIFGNGSTSRPSIQASYTNATTGATSTENFQLNTARSSNFTQGPGNEVSRTLSFQSTTNPELHFNIIQHIEIGQRSDTEQYYNIDYTVENTSDLDLDISFSFNADTAYNNQDSTEDYYTNGSYIDVFTMYTTDPDLLAGSHTPRQESAIVPSVPDSFSIIHTENALPFSQRIKFTNDKPDTVVIGRYGTWTQNNQYFHSLPSIGDSTSRKDKIITMNWNRTVNASSSYTFSFQYGIADTTRDENLDPTLINPSGDTSQHTDTLNLWIQIGPTEGNGLFLELPEINREILGLTQVDLHDYASASRSIALVTEAIDDISAYRSSIGAQQNRLEHAFANDQSMSENSQAAESRLRDTDYAKEELKHAASQITQQAGSAMLAQANSQNEALLKLLK